MYIIDDIGYIQQSKEEVEVLFTLIAECYERTSILLTSNLPFSKWENIFKDPMIIAAAIDRLVHHSVVLEVNVKSYRLEESQKKQALKIKKIIYIIPPWGDGLQRVERVKRVLEGKEKSLK